MIRIIDRVIEKKLKSEDYTKEVTEAYRNVFFLNGIVNSLKIKNKSVLMEIYLEKSYKYRTSLHIEFELFCVPTNFYIPNAVVDQIKSESLNPLSIRFKCELFNGVTRMDCSNFIYPLITSDNKTGEKLRKYNSLNVGDIVNLVCIKQSNFNGKNVLSVSCDLMDRIKPICFKANGNIAAIFNDNQFVRDCCNLDGVDITKKVEVLEEGKYYYATPIGFFASKDGIDYIDDIDDYIKSVVDNWNFLFKNNMKVNDNQRQSILKFIQ